MDALLADMNPEDVTLDAVSESDSDAPDFTQSSSGASSLTSFSNVTDLEETLA